MKKNRIHKEKEIVETMIRLYCQKKEGNKELCNECKELIEYAHHRLESCKYGNSKPTCRVCPIHCYKPIMKERIKAVMRYSGPRLILYHPIAALRHTFSELLPTPKSRIK